MLVRMARVDIVAPRRSGEALLRCVHRSGVVHLVPFAPPPDAGPALFAVEPASVPTARARQLVERLAETRALLGAVPARPSDVAVLWDLGLADLERREAPLAGVRAEAARLTALRTHLLAARDRALRYAELIGGLERVVGHVPVLPGYGATGIVVDARHRAVFPLLRDELEALTGGRCELVTGELDADRVAALLVYPLRDAAAVASLIGGRNLEDMALPEDDAGVPLADLAPRLARREARREEEIGEVETALADLAGRVGLAVAALAAVAGDRLAELEVLAGVGVSDHRVCLSGWVPVDEVGDLARCLERDVGGSTVVLERGEASRPPTDAPVALRNGPYLRAFEPLTTFVAVPRYGTLDPTPLLALMFPAFAGLMIGDVGYGLVILAILALARWRFSASPVMRAVWPIGFAVGGATVVFGVLFGEWFGDLGHRLAGVEPIWISREEAFFPLLALAIAIGVAQVGLGLVLGAANSARLHQRREAIGRLSVAVVLATGLLGLAALAGIVAPGIGTAALVALGGAVVLAFLSVGLAGPIEALGLLGRVLSYARLTAIALASVTLAVVANQLGDLAGNVVVGALIALLLHALNLAVGIFDASIQGLRLHYVEFFGTFVESGGTPYAPFASAIVRVAEPSAAGSPGGA